MIYLIAWYLSGIASFIYWWTTQYDFTTRQLPLALAVGFSGPIGFVMGYYVHGKKREEITLIKHRKQLRRSQK